MREIASRSNLHHISKIEKYRTVQEEISNWDDFLLENSGLPGRRGPRLDQDKRDAF